MTQSEISIQGRRIGAGHTPVVIAEVAQAHDGSLGAAHALIDIAADAGVDAVKFQTHIAEAESTLDEPFRVKFSRQDETRYAYWKRMEFAPEQWQGLANHARERGLIFLSSAFSLRAVELLDRIGMPAWKIGSGEVASEDMIAAMVATGAPILLSTGMSTMDEVAAAVARIAALGGTFAILQCTSRYPTPYEEVGLNVLDEFRTRFACPVGLSDHSGTPWPGLAALAHGANLLEVHVTMSREAFGPDVPASLTPAELRLLVDARNAFATMRTNPVDKDAMAAELSATRETFGRSLAPARWLKKGEVLSADMLTLKKPGSGIPAAERDRLMGRRLARDVPPNRLLRLDDLES